jgi:hypothetical protein
MKMTLPHIPLPAGAISSPKSTKTTFAREAAKVGLGKALLHPAPAKRDAVRQGRLTARSTMDARAHAEADAGKSANLLTRERRELRAKELLGVELSKLESPVPPETRSADPGSRALPERSPPAEQLPPTTPRAVAGPSGPKEPSVSSRSEAMMDLVEKIEVFVKSQRPALALTLRGPAAGKVELERVGPRQISVKLTGSPQATRGLSSQELQGALSNRGLTLTRLKLG